MQMVVWKAFLTVFSILFLIAVHYSRKPWVAGQNTGFADFVDEAKPMFYVWIPFFNVAMWADLPTLTFVVVGVVLVIGLKVYSILHARTKK